MNLAALGNAASLLAQATPHEKSKTAFYLFGGLLAGWAVLVGVFGFTHPDFPGSAGRGRLVMLISGILVVAAASAAAITGSTPPPAPPFVHVKLQPKGVAPTPTPLASGAPAPTPTAPSAPPGTTVLAADPAGSLAFSATTLTVTAKAGKVTIAFTNASPVPHNLTLSRGSTTLGTTPTFQGGGTKNLVLTLAAGRYTYYCTVPGHRQAGMEGTLTVQ